jgi:hypothetical protein
LGSIVDGIISIFRGVRFVVTASAVHLTAKAVTTNASPHLFEIIQLMKLRVEFGQPGFYVFF